MENRVDEDLCSLHYRKGQFLDNLIGEDQLRKFYSSDRAQNPSAGIALSAVASKLASASGMLKQYRESYTVPQ